PSKIAAPFELVFDFSFSVSLLQNLDRFVVGDARESWLYVFQLAHIAANHLEISATAFETALHDEADKVLCQLHDVIERRVGDFGLDHPEFSEVATRLGFLGAEGRAE